jgi:single-strand DNA-binding protein
LNKIVVSGNICHDLEIKTSGETKILNFTVAVRRRFKDKEGNYPSDFIRCVAFNNTAEFISKFFQKGSPILVEGSLQSNSYETESGEKRTSYNVVIENTDFFGRRNDNNQTQNNNFEQTMQQNGVEFNVVDDNSELPF